MNANGSTATGSTPRAGAAGRPTGPRQPQRRRRDRLRALADALNQITPPAEFALRHRQLVTEARGLASSPYDPSSFKGAERGADEGALEGGLIKLAHADDPNSGY